MRPAYTIIYICGQKTRKLLIMFKTNDRIKGFSQNLNAFYGNCFPCLSTIAINIFLLTPDRPTYWIKRALCGCFFNLLSLICILTGWIVIEGQIHVY